MIIEPDESVLEAAVDQSQQQSHRDDNRARWADPSHVFVNAYGQSSIGKTRESNEDHFLIAVFNRQLEIVQTNIGGDDGQDLDEPAEHGWVFLVADGIGGRPSGRQASALTARTSLGYLRSAMPWFASLGPDQFERAEKALKTVVRKTHGSVLAADPNPKPSHGMGSTLTLAFVLWPHLFVVHTGDSRCYLLREGSIRQLTTDHTLAEELPEIEDEGACAVADVKNAEHILTRAVGAGQSHPPEPSVTRWTLRDRDNLVLCSDGLTESIEGEQIRDILGNETFANARCQALNEAARAAGATDDITVVVASFEDFAARAAES